MNERLSTFHYSELLEQRFQSGMLAELQAYPNFVTWILTREGKKLPINPITGEAASPTDPQTWSSLQDALTALKRGRGQGIGFTFSEEDPFTGVDLDHSINGNTIIPEAQEIVTQFDSYTELSPSRTGLHIIVKGTLPHARKTKSIEMYSSKRFFTLTTNHLKTAPYTIEERQPQLDTLYASLTTHEGHRQTIQPQEYQLFVDDDVALENAKKAPNGAAFESLFDGNIAGFTSKSNADWQLVLRLIYWTNGDAQQIRRLFLRSKLVDEKTLRPTKGSTYLDLTIENALKKHWKI